MRGTVAKELRRAAYGDQALRERKYTVVRHRNLKRTWTLHVADPGRLGLNAAKRARADRSTPDLAAGRRVELAERRKRGRQKRRAKEAAQRRAAQLAPLTVADVLNTAAVESVERQSA